MKDELDPAVTCSLSVHFSACEQKRGNGTFVLNVGLFKHLYDELR